MRCGTCGSESADFFSITRIRGGAEVIRAEVCSTTCALKWFYAFTALQGTRMAYGVREAVKQLFGALKP